MGRNLHISRMQSQTETLYRNYCDKAFVAEHISQLKTYLFVGTTSMHIILAKPHTHELAGFFSIELASQADQLSLSAFKQVLSGLPFDISGTEQVVVYLIQPKYTLVPEALFVAEKASALYTIVHSPEKFHTVQHARTPFGIVLYATHDIFMGTLRLALPGAEVMHAMQCMLPAFSKLQDSSGKLQLVLHERYMDVLCFNKLNLSYCNRFPFESDTDIIYFVLSIAEAMHLNQEKLEVWISGHIASTSGLLSLMRKYIQTVVVVQRPDGFTYPAAFRELQDQHYVPFLSPLL